MFVTPATRCVQTKEELGPLITRRRGSLPSLPAKTAREKEYELNEIATGKKET